MLRLMLLVVLCLAVAQSANPGARVRLTQKGMNYALQKVVGKLPSQVIGQKLSDIHERKRTLAYKYDVTVKNIRVTRFTLPAATVTVTASQGIKLSIGNAYLEIEGDWRGYFRALIISWRNTGRLIAKAHNINIDVAFKLGMDGNGRPTMIPTSCSTSIGKIEVDVKDTGMMNKIYEVIVNALIRGTKNELPPKVCAAVNNVLREDANKIFAGLKVVTEIGPHKEMILDYRLTQAPSFQNQYFDVMIKGEFVWKQNPAPPPFQAKPFPASPDYSRMFYVWLSDYVINTYANAYYVREKVKTVVRRSMLAPGQGDFLNTTCPNLKSGCIGSRIITIGEKHPNKACTLGLRATTRPFVNIQPTGMVFHVTGDMPVHVPTPLGDVYLFTLEGTVDMDIFVWIEGTMLKGKINSLKPSIKVKDSVVGDISTGFINWLFEEVSQKYIVKELNEIAGRGLPIPNVKELRFVHPTLQLHSGSIMVASDLVWAA